MGIPTATRRSWQQHFRRPWIVGPLVVVLAVGVWWFGFHSSGTSASAASATQQLVAVTKGPIGSSVSAEGTVAAAQTANLDFTASGQVAAVNVKAGDAVTSGQVLATLDSAQLAAAVTSAQSTIATAQAKLSDDQASGASADQITADQTSVDSANDDLTNAQQALAGASLVATFDGTVSQVNVTAGENLSSNGTGGTSTTGSGTGSGQSSSTLGTGTAGGGGGFGGSGNAASSSSTGSTSSPDIQVISQGQYSVPLSVGASDIGRVAVGQSATVTVTTSSATGGRGGFFAQLFGGAGGRAGGTGGAGGGGTGGGGTGGAAAASGTGASATGVVSSVSQVASATSGVAGYPVVISFNADAKAFYAGATVTGAIATEAKNDVIQVPTRAVSTQNGKSVVTVATNGKLGGPTETRTVTTGITAGGQTEITSGLKAGEQVVLTLPGAFGGFNRTGTGGGGFGGGAGVGGGAGRGSGGVGGSGG